MNTSLAEFFLEQDPYEAVQRVADALEKDAKIERPRVYFVSTLKNRFIRVSGMRRETLPIAFPAEEGACLVKSERDGCVLAFVVSDNNEAGLPEETRKTVQGMLLHFFDQCFVANYVKKIRKPVDFTKTDTYYEETARLLSEALGMPMVAIRRLNADGDLEELCFFDHEGRPISNQGFSAKNMPPPFLDVFNDTEDRIKKDDLGNIHPEYHCDIDLSDPKYEFLTRNRLLRQVKTFVIFPVVYGHDLFGMMSCASRCRYVFSDFQKHAVSGLMQIIGVAISNFLRYHEARELHLLRTEQIVETTAVEVAKSTKHELNNTQAEVSTRFVEVKKAVTTNQTKLIPPALQVLGESIDKLIPSIQKLSFGDKGDKNPESASVKTIWNNAVELSSKRLKRTGIDHHHQGSDCAGEFYVEMMKNAFLNLILNSIDAFNGNRRKGGRKITVVASIVSGGKRFQIDYSDNAGGLVQSKSSYRIPEARQTEYSGMPMKELIFEPKVSSKGGHGSGWGLYLVRRAIETHKGSINLADAKNGCTFRIEMPIHPDK